MYICRTKGHQGATLSFKSQYYRDGIKEDKPNIWKECLKLWILLAASESPRLSLTEVGFNRPKESTKKLQLLESV